MRTDRPTDRQTDRQTDRPTDRQTDIATCRAAIAAKNNLHQLKIGDNIVSNPEIIEKEVTGFFGALLNGYHDSSLNVTGSTFIPDNSNLEEFLRPLIKMSKEDSDGMTQSIDPEELDIIIKKCPNNKSPGFDGISYEFYKTTWPIICQTFTQVLQCQLDRQKLVASNTVGAVRLLPKVEGTPKLDELRPITLLNCDYKILTKLFVQRIRPVLPEIIQSGQLCSVGKRSILFGIQNILSSICYVNQKNLGACLLSLDFFKAYDRVMISFLLCVMKRM